MTLSDIKDKYENEINYLYESLSITLSQRPSYNNCSHSLSDYE